MRFSALLESYRVRKNITKAELARCIGKTDAYIHKLEKDNYTPPIFSVCKKMVEKLGLSNEETSTFIKTAFLERIRNEQEFYDYVKEHDFDNPEFSLTTLVDEKDTTEKDGVISKCTYLITWPTKTKKNILSDNIKVSLDQIIHNSADQFGHKIHFLNIRPNFVELLVDIEPDANISYFIKGLKNLSENKICDDNNISLRSLWSRNYSVFTVGNLDNLKTNISSDQYISVR